MNMEELVAGLGSPLFCSYAHEEQPGVYSLLGVRTLPVITDDFPFVWTFQVVFPRMNVRVGLWSTYKLIVRKDNGDLLIESEFEGVAGGIPKELAEMPDMFIVSASPPVEAEFDQAGSIEVVVRFEQEERMIASLDVLAETPPPSKSRRKK